MNAFELRERYQDFFSALGHRRLPSASLVPENDPSVLFTTAGMHPLVPFLLGESHPLGKRLVNVQRCLRTGDIDVVGDDSHLTFFEMLGNWSLGDYFKRESLVWSYQFLIGELGVDPADLAVTFFGGDQFVDRDDLSEGIWRSLGIPSDRIFPLTKKENWWGPVGRIGPCGPDSEIFIDTGKSAHPGCQPGCNCGKWLEIWNNVFMEFNQTIDGSYERLLQRNVDTGMGLDRTLWVLNGFNDLYKIDTLSPIILGIENLTGKDYEENKRPFRIIADHLRASTLAIADGVYPANLEAGYIVRRLIRRAVRFGHNLGIQGQFCATLAQIVLNIFVPLYPGIDLHRQRIIDEIQSEETKFEATLERGLKQYQKVIEKISRGEERMVPGDLAFDLFETYGFPLQITKELAGEQGFEVDEQGFQNCMVSHKDISRQGSDLKYKGGLADQTYKTTRLHTATHLLQAALRQVLGNTVQQMGSNITPDRLRFDFRYSEKLTDEQIKRAEDLVNDLVKQDWPVTMEVMPLEKAQSEGALAFFGEKYGEQVKVYTIGHFSKEVCGGPHVSHTAELGLFKIVKQEAVGRGLRRVKGTLT
jgi:alanyl-tRNA synthetase